MKKSDRFDDGAKSYDTRIKMLIPGYDLIHNLTTIKVLQRKPKKAKILIVGAGTGNELIKLAKQNPLWEFTALDIAENMLSIAKQKCIEENITNKINFINQDVYILPKNKKYDIIICILVSQFIKNTDEKINFYKRLYQLLKKNSYLYLADFMTPNDKSDYKAYSMISIMQGYPYVLKKQLINALKKDFSKISKNKLKEYLTSIGFDRIECYYQALYLQAFECKKI